VQHIDDFAEFHFLLLVTLATGTESALEIASIGRVELEMIGNYETMSI
jgi:hypothetical protein